MRRHDPLSLGIEIGEREVRLVQVSTRGGRSSIHRTITEPLPEGAVMAGVPLQPEAVVAALRRALDSIGTPSTATLAVSGEQTIFRTVTVPPCPDSEVPALVASEIEHQNALNSGDSFGYFPIYPADAEDTGLRSMVVVGVDGSVTRSLVEIAEGVGLSVEALEPAPLAALRAACRELSPNDSAFLLVVGSGYSDAAFFLEGKLVALRRLDIGFDMLLQVPLIPAWEVEGLEPLFSFTSPQALEAVSPVNAEAVERLAVEAQRTVDYVQRASQGAASIERIRILGDDPEIETIANLLEGHLGMPVEIARAPSVDGQPADVRFGPAYGLAIRHLHAGLPSPSVDLFTAERSEAERVERKRYFLGSVLVAGLSIAVGLTACVLYNRQIAACQQRSAGIVADTQKAKASADAALEARANEALRDKVLRKEGVPLGDLMDSIASGLDSGVGLKLVTVNDDLSVRLQGEAHDETALVRTAQALKSSPVLQNVAVNHFDRDEKSPHGLIKFELAGQTVSDDRIKESPRG